MKTLPKNLNISFTFQICCPENSKVKCSNASGWYTSLYIILIQRAISTSGSGVSVFALMPSSQLKDFGHFCIFPPCPPTSLLGTPMTVLRPWTFREQGTLAVQFGLSPLHFQVISLNRCPFKTWRDVLVLVYQIIKVIMYVYDMHIEAML